MYPRDKFLPLPPPLFVSFPLFSRMRIREFRPSLKGWKKKKNGEIRRITALRDASNMNESQMASKKRTWNVKKKKEGGTAETLTFVRIDFSAHRPTQRVRAFDQPWRKPTQLALSPNYYDPTKMPDNRVNRAWIESNKITIPFSPVFYVLIKRAPTPAFGGEGRGKKDCRNIAKFKSILSCATLIYKDDRLRNYTYSRVSIISYLFHLHLISISRHQALLTRYPLRFITIDSRGGKNRMLKDNRYRKKKGISNYTRKRTKYKIAGAGGKSFENRVR